MLLLVAAAATAVALTLDPLKQVVMSSVYGLLLVILFVALEAPDVALSMLVVSSVAYPFIVLVAISRTRRRRGGEG